ncbi:MAG TPA: thioredoxin family protein [Chitinophagaceae bacterium]|jgi:thioredoxin-related protein
MKKIGMLLLILISSVLVFSQDMTKFKLYNPDENAEGAIAKAVAQAKAEKKHVLIEIGGNWCIWCARFNDFTTNDRQIDSIMKASYVIYHLNYSKDNFNAKLLAKYGYPQRFGFPVFLILNADGQLIHTQNSGYLEDGKKSYDHDKVFGFFADWTPIALDPSQYKEQ